MQSSLATPRDMPEPIDPQVIEARAQHLIEYVASVCGTLFGLRDASPLNALFALQETRGCVKRFVSDPTHTSLYVSQAQGLEAGSTDFKVTLEPSTSEHAHITVAISKISTDDLDLSRPLITQLHITNFVQKSCVDDLNSIIRNSLSPFFRTYASKIQTQRNLDQETRSNIVGIRKRLNELEVTLGQFTGSYIQLTRLVPNEIIRQSLQRDPSGQQDIDQFSNSAESLNALTDTMREWILEVRSFVETVSNRKIGASGSLKQESLFWANTERNLQHIQAFKKEAETNYTINILKRGRRFQIVSSYEAETGLGDFAEKVTSISQLFKMIPLEMTSAEEILQIKKGIEDIWNHLKRHRTLNIEATDYQGVIELVFRELINTFVRVIDKLNIMDVSYPDFIRIQEDWNALFKFTEDTRTSIREVVREINKKRGEQIRGHTIFENKQLRERLVDIGHFRKEHEELLTVMVRVFGGKGDSVHHREAIQKLDDAYQSVKKFAPNPVDISEEGTANWTRALAEYKSMIENIENSISILLRNKLKTATSASEMLVVFSQFNELFRRNIIRQAINEYQRELFIKVKNDIKSLQEKFSSPFAQSEANRLGQVYDIQSVVRYVIWARQIEAQLNAYMKRVEDVLGPDWEKQPEGAKLKQESDGFRQKLNTDLTVKKWLAEMSSKKPEIRGPIFYFQKKSGFYAIHVNFDMSISALVKEARQLGSLRIKIPSNIESFMTDFGEVYPHAVSLQESVRTYQVNNALITLEITFLMQGPKVTVQKLLEKGVKISWSDRNLEDYCSELSNEVSVYEDLVQDARSKSEDIRKLIRSLLECPMDKSAFLAIIKNIQKIIDQLSLRPFTNIDLWLKEIDAEIGKVLAVRLKQSIEEWIRNYTSTEDRKEAAASSEIWADDVYEVILKSQQLRVEPPIENARLKWTAIMRYHIDRICGLPRLKSSQFEHFQTELTPSELTYRDLISQISEELLEKCYDLLDATYSEFSTFCGSWLRYQNLWSLDFTQIQSTLGRDIKKWQNLLADVNKARNTFDTTETSKSFGPIVVNYHQVQETVRNKYDFIQGELLKNFKQVLFEESNRVIGNLRDSRSSLEKSKINPTRFQETISLLNNVKDYGSKAEVWEVEVNHCIEGNRYILTLRWSALPEKWISIDILVSEMESFKQIYQKKKTLIEEKVPELKETVHNEIRLVQSKVEKMEKAWRESNLTRGDLHPEVSLKKLEFFLNEQAQLKENINQISKASQVLEGIGATVSMGTIGDEIEDTRKVWETLRPIWHEIDAIKARKIKTVSAREIRQKLDELSNQMQTFPAIVRSYEAFSHLSNQLKKWIASNALIGDMRSESIRERHWNQIRKITSIRTSMEETTMSIIWDADVKSKEVDIRAILTTAQGEMALEEFLKQLDLKWSEMEFVFTSYHQRVYIVKSWDDLFNNLNESITNLGSMKLSPYFKEFEKFAVEWEERLNRLRLLLDVWVDVQRRWSYLEGVFQGSADIKTLLPQETARFRNIDGEFCDIMKKVVQKRRVLEVGNIENIQRSFERMSESLVKIQRSLVEYLERQRVAFPRFFFIGDEDLLDIIGNSKELGRVQKHLRKMFAGLSRLNFDSQGTSVVSFSSKDDETVMFSNPVTISPEMQIYDWLNSIERNMKISVSDQIASVVSSMKDSYAADLLNREPLSAAIDQYPDQMTLLATQILWTADVQRSLKGPPTNLDIAMKRVIDFLEMLAQQLLSNLDPTQRKKREHLITELVHQRDVIRRLIQNDVNLATDFEWMYFMRFMLNTNANPLNRISIVMANAEINYGYEYLGVAERLVQTPLTDRCYLTLTQAIHNRMGGSPFGPAGTGKTETVKALGSQLGRFVLVFNCDETFDFQAMGRIFLGLCQCGAWGCFDEFNRLEERIMSAVSQQIQTIQVALRDRLSKVELLGKQVSLNPEMGIFITMNPGYAGRRNLPDNLKQLFRSVAMVKPDRELIAQVMLFSQGFRSAEGLSSKIVPLFHLCHEQLSPQPHYDFGLRALKSVLISAGNIKRKYGDISSGDYVVVEQQILIRSICETIVPKLLGDDITLLHNLLSDVFPQTSIPQMDMPDLMREAELICKEKCYLMTQQWSTKIIQLAQIQEIHHGIMLVGPSGTGKSSAWKVYLEAMEKLDGKKSEFYVIDPKAISKEHLYGVLDPNTREWTDGLFTHILRKIIDNVRGELLKRHWIIFDGDVDPEWVENLNSVLDDNKMMTLPNGERLALPSNVHIVFEVQDLKYATLATVSRCGMVWFSPDTVTPYMVLQNHLLHLQSHELSDLDDIDLIRGSGQNSRLAVQNVCAQVLEPPFRENGFVIQALHEAQKYKHIMDFTWPRALTSLFGLIDKAIRSIFEYNARHFDFQLTPEQIRMYLSKRLLNSVVWAFAGSATLNDRIEFGSMVCSLANITLPNSTSSLIDYEVQLPDGAWIHLKTKVPRVEIETHKISSTDVVITTIDTVRHQEMIGSWLLDHKPLILCGPPGSGKTMTLQSTLNSLNDYELLVINFSSTTSPALLMSTFENYCEYKKNPDGYILRPKQASKWLVIFCDEINLPACDKYGTQRVIAFIRQLIEQGGFWRNPEMLWVKLERIQFVGACNPPTDPGRVPLSHRFMRHAPIVYVDFPSPDSLTQIYGTFIRSLFKMVPNLRQYAEPFTDAMIQFYLASQKKFTPDIHPHYIYSPRELSRWVRALYEGVKSGDVGTLESLLRLFAHEGLRLFYDRLVSIDEREWTNRALDDVIRQNFTRLDMSAIQRPILFSDWLSRRYMSVDREIFRDFVKARLKTFYEEELDVPLVLFNEVLDHVLRIDRVLHQPQGHMLLIGVSGAGKTVLSRFVAWVNGLSIYQIKVSKRYTGEDFDKDLREVLRRTGCKGEKICFIFDESNVLDSSFLERMNALLASGEVPGLFEGDEKVALNHLLKESAQREGLLSASEDELYKWFISRIQTNLHVIFTMNPASGDFYDRSVSSPALFNRCVVDWFGNWSTDALYQVALEFTNSLDLDNPTYIAPTTCKAENFRDAIIRSLVYVHSSIADVNAQLLRKYGRCDYVSPRHFLDYIKHYVTLFNEKRSDLEDQQLHLNIGLQKLKDTEQQIAELKIQLQQKRETLDIMKRKADEKLALVVKNTQEAEKSKKEATEIQKQLDEQSREIEKEKSDAQIQLAKAEPALIEAQKAVGGIRKAQLDEIRALGNPPRLVQLTLEAVCYLFSHQKESWDTIRISIRKEDFISNILKFDSTKMSEPDRVAIQNYFKMEGFNYEKVSNASKVCGPLVNWLQAQIYYSRILENIEPLRKKITVLEQTAMEQRVKYEELARTITELEDRITVYKDEYQILIKDQQAIQEELSRVESKVSRSTSLLQNLKSERTRWDQESASFQRQISTLAGDIIIAAGFCTYCGYLDQHYRTSVIQKWQDFLVDYKIPHRQDLSIIEYLSNPDQRLSWIADSLPTDELCTENAIILNRFHRYPLIIDPSGQATEFILKSNASKKIIKTSFLDESFMKSLESCLRFGYPLLVQDVERIDPILNPVLNREIHKTGGRTLIRLGDQEIDFSPSFCIYLTTRDPTFCFPPDICSRVSFVNFTVTNASLSSQCLNQIMRMERPDIEQKRADIYKLQGEFRVKLRKLEKSLLTALSEAQGSILDDDHVISTLEQLKNEAGQISRKAAEAENVMQEVNDVSAIYKPFADSCSRVYFTLEELGIIHPLYQFSLGFFMDAFNKVLNSTPTKKTSDAVSRLALLKYDIFSLLYQKVSRGLLNEDKLLFAFHLALIYLNGNENEPDPLELSYILKGSETQSGSWTMLPSWMSDVERKLIAQVSIAVPSLREIVSVVSAQQTDFETYKRLTSLSQVDFAVGKERSAIINKFHKILFTKIFRPEFLCDAVEEFVGLVFDNPRFVETKAVDIQSIYKDDLSATTPMLLCSRPGYDPTTLVDIAAAQLGKELNIVAIGSAEGFDLAEKAINVAAKNGFWAMLKNIHLAPQWLSQLEKKLYTLKPHPDFRIFLAMEIQGAVVPVNLIRSARVFVFEQPSGMKPQLMNIFSNSVTPSRSSKDPIERARIHFLVAWIHSLMQQRLQYAPIGWSKHYEFNENDLKCSLETVDYWIDQVAGNRRNVDVERVPWVAIRTILKDSIYGGRIDNEFDQKILASLVDHLFVPAAYMHGFNLVGDASHAVSIPDCVTYQQFKSWINELPAFESPVLYGLDPSANVVMRTNQGDSLLRKVLKIQSIYDEEKAISDDEVAGESRVPAWMAPLKITASEWLTMLPKNIPQPTWVASSSDPLARVFQREAEIARKLLRLVREDLESVVAVADGRDRLTNRSRELMADLSKAVVPASWKSYPVDSNMTTSTWIHDLLRRLEQLVSVIESKSIHTMPIWLGGLFSPEAFITATRQAFARHHSWSLETLEMHVQIGEPLSRAEFSYQIKGVSLLGAFWNGSAMEMSDKLVDELPLCYLSWAPKSVSPVQTTAAITIPFYLNQSRKQLLFSVSVPVQSSSSELSVWYRRGIAAVVWNHAQV